MARLLLILFFLSVPAFSQCISISDAQQHIGKKTCVAAKVIKVTENENGTFVLNFCNEGTTCPFVVRVFPVDFDYVGDVRQLEGKEIEITGKVRKSNDQVEIVLRDADQLKGEPIKLPPIPKVYDAERRGNTSPGQFKGAKTTKRSRKTATPAPIQQDDEE